jgi:ABC-type glutathione transport system ATPase component
VAGGTAVVVSTHDERFIASFATRIVRLEAGRVVEDVPAGRADRPGHSADSVVGAAPAFDLLVTAVPQAQPARPNP